MAPKHSVQKLAQPADKEADAQKEYHRKKSIRHLASSWQHSVLADDLPAADAVAKLAGDRGYAAYFNEAITALIKADAVLKVDARFQALVQSSAAMETGAQGQQMEGEGKVGVADGTAAAAGQRGDGHGEDIVVGAKARPERVARELALVRTWEEEGAQSLGGNGGGGGARESKAPPGGSRQRRKPRGRGQA
ncbi:hypothetical protein LTR65_009837 [Meristemomyces frigidus]